tara:strand:+ start:142 stop:444 length:303 start_codon:yes stop_codon:yes gene_type:complete
MKQTINFYDFSEAFRNAGRANQFTYGGQRALFEYLEQYEEDCDTEIEFDVIALCCEYVEYESLEDFHLEYDKEDYPDLDTLSEHTQLIKINSDSFIIACF